MASSSANSDRRGKLSLKRKRNVENCGEHDDSVASSEQAKRISVAGGRDTERFANGPSDDEKCGSSMTSKGRVWCHDSGPVSPSGLSARPVCNRASTDSNPLSSSLDQSDLPDLPPWYCVKKYEAEPRDTRTEVIKVGDVSAEWRPLPAYCRMCLVRSKQKRAAEHQKQAKIKSHDQQSVAPSDTSRRSQMPTPPIAIPALQTRSPQENLDLSEVIVLDSDGEEECRPTSTLTGSKRKLSTSPRDADRRSHKKPKRAQVSDTGDSGSLAAEFVPRPKSPVPGQVKPGRSKTLQTRLDGLLVRTSSGHSKMQTSTPSSNHQESSLGKPFTAYQTSPECSKQTPTNNLVNKHGSLTQIRHLRASSAKPSAQNSAWNKSTNVKPLFKKQTSGQLCSAQEQTAGQDRAKVQACGSSYPKNDSQKNLHFANTKRTHQNVFHKVPLSEGRMSSLAHLATNTNSSRNPLPQQPTNQAVFRSNKVARPLGHPTEKSSTSTPQTANTGLYVHTGFRTARDVRTDQDTTPKQDVHPNTVEDKQVLQGKSRPEGGSNHRNEPKGVNRGTTSNQLTHQELPNCASITSCPLCGNQFPKRWTAEKRDGHIKLCLSATASDVVW